MNERASLRRNPQGDLPRVEESAYIDPSAIVLGRVRIGKDVFLGPGAVIRADENGSSIEIMEGCNIQDRVIIHALRETSVTIARNASLSHGCIVHGPCSIGADCFIGFGSVVFRAVLGEGVIVKHLAVVEGVRIEPGRVVDSTSRIDTQETADGLEPAGNDLCEFVKGVVRENQVLRSGYLGSSHTGAQFRHRTKP